MIVRSKAPLRISYGGGGTDVSPYFEERGGAVVSITIDKYAYCTLSTRADDQVRVKSLDSGAVANYQASEEFQYDGKLDLVKATVKVMKPANGFELFLHSDAPPGSGLGASSAVVVALVGLFKHYQKLPLTDYEIAELAYHIEREELAISGGKQDQYAATFGGFNFIEFSKDKVVVNPLHMKRETLNELEYRSLLYYVGKTRASAGIIDDQVSRYLRGEEDTVKALDTTKSLAIEMKNALLLGNIDECGYLLDAAWQAKKRFSAKISDPQIDEMYEVAKKKGALGGKLLGAGGGGHLLLFCQFDKRHVVAGELERLGGKLVDFAFEFNGLQTWEVNTNKL